MEWRGGVEASAGNETTAQAAPSFGNDTKKDRS